MVHTRFTIGGGWAFVKYKIALGGWFIYRLLEDMVRFPKSYNRLLQAGETGRFFNIVKHDYRTPCGYRAVIKSAIAKPYSSTLGR
ncbi:hypothetical protein U2F10_07875 [Leptothoe sp. EHU-05/26/07-4]